VGSVRRVKGACIIGVQQPLSGSIGIESSAAAGADLSWPSETYCVRVDRATAGTSIDAQLIRHNGIPSRILQDVKCKDDIIGRKWVPSEKAQAMPQVDRISAVVWANFPAAG